MAAHSNLIYKRNHISTREREIGKVGRECGRIGIEIDVETACVPAALGSETDRESGRQTDGGGGGGDRETGERERNVGG